jgi:leader peptidase (prepilin peptidase)/N-methyltransferase
VIAGSDGYPPGVPLIIICAVLGLAVGSFLNVVIWRVPRGESVVRPPSACPSCGMRLRAYDNVPVLSWLVLRGRCRGCGDRISARYPVVELTTAVVFGLIAARFGLTAELPAFLFLGALGVALTAIDLDVYRLPNALTLPAYPVVIALLGVASLAGPGAEPMLRGVAGLLLLVGFYFVLFVVGGMGLGDVKFAGVLGFALGWLGWQQLIVGTALGFLLGGLVSMVLLLGGRAGRKSRIAFGPYMIAGALVAVVAGAELASAYIDALVS